MQKEALNKKIIGDLKLLQYQWFRKDSSINYLNFIGDTINNIPITLSGIVASCHIGGSMGTIRWFDSQGKRNPGDTNRSTIGAYMLEFSNYKFNLKELQCSVNSGNGLTLSTKQSKSSITVPHFTGTGTAMILRSHATLNLHIDTFQYRLALMKSTWGYKQHCQSTTEVYSISEAPHQSGMVILMLLGMGKSSGITVVGGKEQLQVQDHKSVWQERVIDYFNSILSQFGMLLSMLRFAICSLNLAL